MTYTPPRQLDVKRTLAKNIRNVKKNNGGIFKEGGASDGLGDTDNTNKKCKRMHEVENKNVLPSIPRIGESHQLGTQQGKGKTEVHGA